MNYSFLLVGHETVQCVDKNSGKLEAFIPKVLDCFVCSKRHNTGSKVGPFSLEDAQN